MNRCTPYLNPVATPEGTFDIEILQFAMIFLLRQTNNENVTRGNVVVESTPRETCPRSLNGVPCSYFTSAQF